MILKLFPKLPFFLSNLGYFLLLFKNFWYNWRRHVFDYLYRNVLVLVHLKLGFIETLECFWNLKLFCNIFCIEYNSYKFMYWCNNWNSVINTFNWSVAFVVQLHVAITNSWRMFLCLKQLMSALGRFLTNIYKELLEMIKL